MKKYTAYLFLIAFLCNCSDFLEVTPREETSTEELFSTYGGTIQVLNGAYYRTEEILSTKLFLYADIQGGNITFSPTRTGSNAGTIGIPSVFQNTYNFVDNAQTSEFSYLYSNSYTALANINNILFFVDGLTDASEQQKNQIKAEALALRGFLHFNLLQIYAQNYSFSPDGSHLGIVYADQRFLGGVDYPSRKSVADCYELLTRDLENALDSFGSQQATSGPVYSVFNPTSTKALLARVALQKRDWATALSYASDVIATSGIALMPTANYVSQWENPNLPVSEVILEFTIPISSDGEVTPSNTVSEYFKYIISNGSVIDYGIYVASPDLIALYGENDVRKEVFHELQLSVATPNGNEQRPFNFTKKFQDNPGTLAIRLSEMYLIVAEAQARLGNTAGASTALNTIKNRAGIPSWNGQNNILDEILLERRKELCFEGHLFFDLARYAKNVVRNEGCLSLTCDLNYPNPKFILPIPQQTINVNQNIIQNESY